MKEIEAWIKEYLAEMDLSVEGLDRSICADNVLTFVLRNVTDSPGQPSKHEDFVLKIKGTGAAIAVRLGAQVMIATSWQTMLLEQTVAYINHTPYWLERTAPKHPEERAAGIHTWWYVR